MIPDRRDGEERCENSLSPILVTGATGFLGAHVLRRLSDCGRPALGIGRRLAPGVQDVDLADDASLARLPAAVAGIIHVAAAVPVKEDVAEVHEMDRVNARGTLALLDRYRGVPWVIVSSGTMEDDAEHYFIDAANLTVRNFYESSKHGAELYAEAFATAYDFPLVVLRCSYLYGPGMRPSTAVMRLVRDAVERGEMRLGQAGAAAFDFLHVRDAAEACCAALEARCAGRYFIGSGLSVTIAELAGTIRDLLPHPCRIAVDGEPPVRNAAVPRTMDEFRRATGWNAKVGLREGVAELIRSLTSS